MTKSYMEVAYPNLSFPLTHPDHLSAVATLKGMRPANVPTCRVLEIGCGRGSNLMPMASNLPQAQFVGLDISREQIDVGRSLADELKIQNLELLVGDIRELDPELGPFDYILAHGVFCWTDENLQDQILKVCRALLRENGIAYVNLNLFPGWHVHGMLRDVLQPHVRSQAADGLEAAKLARQSLESLARSLSATSSAWSTLVCQQIEDLAKRSDEYLFHAYLNQVNRPLYFRDFLEMSRANGLRYLADASNEIQWAHTMFPELAQPLQEMELDDATRQQYWDVVMNRSSRFSLLCRAEVELEADALPNACLRLHAAGNVKLQRERTDGAVSYDVAGKSVTVHDRETRMALDYLAGCWPGSVPLTVLGSLVGLPDSVPAGTWGEAGISGSSWIELLMRLYVADLIQLTGSPARCASSLPRRPAATALVRQQARNGVGVTNLKHQYLQLGDRDRQLLQLLNGVRDCAMLTTDMHEMSRETPLDEAEVETRLQRLLDHSLLSSSVG